MLEDNDSHGFFAALDSQIITGPTKTNVNDFRVILTKNYLAEELSGDVFKFSSRQLAIVRLLPARLYGEAARYSFIF